MHSVRSGRPVNIQCMKWRVNTSVVHWMSSKKEVLLPFSPSKLVSGGSLDTNRIDDEHRLIARYAARLAADANNAVSSFQIKF